MSIEEYDEMMAKQFEYLDKIDIEKYMKNCTIVGDLISAIERDYDDTDFTNNEFLQGCIFSCCNEEEFIEYLEKRYGDRFSSHEYTYHTFNLD